ncbi:MAG: hypothetical protein GX861_03650 [Tenericutes bacterium]|nr:hypothetical protein [Mycoplasmatota bacterium]
MFYDENKTMKACEDDPSLIWELIKEDLPEVVDKLLTKKIIDINYTDQDGNDVLTVLLKKGYYDLVLKHMSNKEWNVNHQNSDGNTFAHILVLINYVKVIDIIKKLRKNLNFIPNIKNNKNESILDKAINDSYIYTTVKILEDKRFNNIDILSFKNLYDTYIKTNNYGRYTKLTNLEVIIDSLDEKSLLPKMDKLIKLIRANFDIIKKEVVNNKTIVIDNIINELLEESNA